MNYEQTIAYLFEHLPMFSNLGAVAYKKDLKNTLLLCEALGNPHHQLKTIHIAGTNGKGSVSHQLSAVLQASGYKTGLYTSPHLIDFRERIKVNGKICSKEFVVDFTQRIMPMIETIQPSFFEITVAMAFDYFRSQETEIAVIETGLGGRLDSTNVITPLLSIITNIGFDHVQILGDTLPQIAFEKAGIIKPNVPVVIGEVLPETEPIFIQKAAECNAPLVVASHQRYAAEWTIEPHQLNVEVADHFNERETYHLDLNGIYQIKNLITVLESIHQLNQLGWHIDKTVAKAALKQVKKWTGFRGRWDVIHQHPTIVLDVAHNPDGVTQIIEQIDITPHNQLHIVIGMVKDKDVNKVLTILPKSAKYYFTKAQIPRAMLETDLSSLAQTHQLKGTAFEEVNTAIQAAITESNPDDLILVCGSVFLVGEVREELL